MRKLRNKITFKIAADGGSASGKTTGGKLIAKKFGMKFLSSGALYRFCAWKILNNKSNYNIKFITKIAKTIKPNKLNDKRLYTPKVTQFSSIIAKRPFVRKALMNFQNNFIKNHNLLIIEGRDIGSKILGSKADLKLFFKCNIKAKAQRRFKEFRRFNKKITLKQVEKALKQRDIEDKKRRISPLRMTKNAVIVDTSKLTIKQMERKLVSIVKCKINLKYGNL